jgi:Flp pilus assembly protein TadG
MSFRRMNSSDDGNIMIEFALALPILCVMLFGMIDLGRFGLQRAAMLEGARAGAEYAVFVLSTTTPAITTWATTANETATNTTAQNATSLTGITATSTMFCECTAGTSITCTTTTCPSSGAAPKKYITVSTGKTFTSVLTRSISGFSTVVGGWTPPSAVSASMTMIVP